ATAEGEKLRRGGQLPVAIFLPAVCGSIPALRPILPFRFRARSAVHFALSSSLCLLLVLLSLSCGSAPTIMVVVSRCAPPGVQFQFSIAKNREVAYLSCTQGTRAHDCFSEAHFAWEQFALQ